MRDVTGYTTMIFPAIFTLEVERMKDIIVILETKPWDIHQELYIIVVYIQTSYARQQLYALFKELLTILTYMHAAADHRLGLISIAM